MHFLRSLGVSLLLLGVVDCAPPDTEQETTLHEIMANSVDPLSDVIWEETGKAYGETGRPEPGKLTSEEWLKVRKAARDLYVAAAKIADNPDIQVVRPGDKLLDEGRVPEAVTAAQVVSYVQRDRSGLTMHARELANQALAMESSAKARDSVKTLILAEELDGICESCHLRFWYPEQSKPSNSKP